MIEKNAKVLTNAMGQGGQIGIITDFGEYKDTYGNLHKEYLIATTADGKTVKEHWYRENEVEVIDAETEEPEEPTEDVFRKYGEGYIEMSRKRKRRILKVAIALAIVSAFWIGFGLGLNA